MNKKRFILDSAAEGFPELEVPAQFQKDLLNWYHKNARVLPWRSQPSPYRVWISEMMLQQTRVDTVIPYFQRFMEALPDIPALAEVTEDKLLKLWQGLGYYNRALNLKKTAQVLMSQYGGQLPPDREALLALPGIGPYSAGAISSIAFGRAVPAVDGNVLRIMARLLASYEDINQGAHKKKMQAFMEKLVSPEEPGNFNQGLMDLGAGICLPNGQPKCPDCPVQAHCKAYRQELTALIPVKIPKKKRRIEEKTVFVIAWQERYALQKRKSGGLLPNLWEFPNREGHLKPEESRELLKDMGIQAVSITPLAASKHIFSHIEWHMKGFLVTGEVDERGASPFTWVTKEEIQQEYSIPTAFQAYTKSLEEE
ncbi:A/G-specific adenine glycosylase [Aminipila butyrica]|uniref:Adenine DNA glycosylase n=1 Tax=Aminipila butyrica TaxID=433296 RepID=A0A858BZ53_9FIRM|nr:A/G-specific adenine glycosylase [Aminipila butyrica]QIB69356.1 A/G-specific adenine glycosylase [Aminipila butyrica]